jgi:2-amino-4-hydroxy-6-hydroxymethyldihydropteridine diphosphokinase
VKFKVQSPKSKVASENFNQRALNIAERLVIIALGSNLGDSKAQIIRAIDRLQELSEEPLRSSSLWETAPIDCPPGSAMFVNAVVVLAPRKRETPESLLKKLQAIQREFGRKRKKVVNEPRPLDLDLVAFGQERRRSRALTLPHPRAHQRRFVLAPLSEIAPDLVLPGQTRTVEDLLQTLPSNDFVQKMA